MAVHLFLCHILEGDEDAGVVNVAELIVQTSAKVHHMCRHIHITLSAKVNIDKDLYDKVNDVYLSIDIPDGCNLIENSVWVNWSEQSYTTNGNSLNIHLTKNQAQNEVRFCVASTEANVYNITAYE